MPSRHVISNDRNQVRSKVQQVSDDVLNIVSYAPPVESYHYHVRKTTIDGRVFDEFKELTADTVFSVEVDSDTLAGIVNVALDSDGEVERVFMPTTFTPGDWFNDIMRPVIPEHIAMRAQNASVKLLQNQRRTEGRRGRQANHPYIVLFDGWCAGSHFRRRGVDRDTCCTTRYYGGINLPKLQRLGATRKNVKIRLEVFSKYFAL